jgi:hypothetical protein
VLTFGLSVDSYLLLNKLAWEEIWDGIRDGARRIASNHFGASEASINFLSSGMPDLLACLKQSGVAIRMAEAVAQQIESLQSPSAGDKDIAYMTEAL